MLFYLMYFDIELWCWDLKINFWDVYSVAKPWWEI